MITSRHPGRAPKVRAPIHPAHGCRVTLLPREFDDETADLDALRDGFVRGHVARACDLVSRETGEF